MIKTEPIFSERMNRIPQSFIREILKVADSKDMISFAGGLPNPEFFPVKELSAASEKVMANDGKSLLQYSVTEGYMPLRAYLANWHEKKSGIRTTAEQVIILNGSQQGIDLAGKVFLSEIDTVLMEAPSYLGAIQSFSALGVNMESVESGEGGISLSQLETKFGNRARLFYSIPSYQNPTGISYSIENRIRVAEITERSGSVLLEDNPYGEIYFNDNSLPEIQNFAPGNTVLLGSFSKMVSPGLRLGWAIAPEKFIKKLVICKQAVDLHSNNFTQRVLFQYLLDNNLEDHLSGIRTFYKKQRDFMLQKIQNYFPEDVKYTIPEGGMFIWVTLPEKLNADRLLEKAIKKNILYVPGSCFFLKGQEKHNTMRLNFSNPTEAEMEKGIKLLGEIIKENL